MIMKDHKRR